MNKADLIQKIKQLEGISQDERSTLIDLVNTKKYGLVWEDKPEEVEEQLRSHLPVLKEVVEKRIKSELGFLGFMDSLDSKKSNHLQGSLFEADKDNSQENKIHQGSDNHTAPNHILIEGDNLHALTALTFTHEGKINVIYIDPPYNTGNKDFKYNDSYVDKEDSYRHSKWLSFMDKRLRIAKRLLSEKGVIFISIDDNEQSPLKLLCDEVFGESNFIGEIVWFKKRKGSFLSNQLISLTEYILPYCKSGPVHLFGGSPDNSESQPIVKRTNSRKHLSFMGNTVKTKLKSGTYKSGTYGEGSIASILLTDIEVYNGLIINDFTINAPFVWSQEFLNAEIENGTEILINTLNLQVRVIRRNNDSIKAMPSFLDGREFAATNEDAYEFLKNMFNTDRSFAYSKPTNLVKMVIKSSSYFNKSSIVLDFFAGSGTTLHATMQLNAEDGGNRQCILVTNNEIDEKTQKELEFKGIVKGTPEFEAYGICQSITYERNRRVIQGYTNSKGLDVPGLSNNNLRYYRCDSVPSMQDEPNKRLLTQSGTDLICIKEDCYTDITESLGFNPSQCKVFTNDKGKMMIVVYYSRKQLEVFEQVTAYVKSLSSLTEPVKLFAFSTEKETLMEDLADVADKIDAVPMPEAVYNAYRAVFTTLRLNEKPPASSTVDFDGIDEVDELFNLTQDGE